MASVITGKLIRKPAKTGTKPAPNQKTDKSIKAITGVDLITLRKKEKKSRQKGYSPHHRPAINAKKAEIKNAEKHLKKENPQSLQKSLEKTITKKSLNTRNGEGRIRAESSKQERKYHTRRKKSPPEILTMIFL